MGVGIGMAQPAALVTDDRNMRVKANAKGVVAISGSALKSILQPQGAAKRRPTTSTRSKMTPLARLRQSFPGETDENLRTVLHNANGNVSVAMMKLYRPPPKKWNKMEQGRGGS